MGEWVTCEITFKAPKKLVENPTEQWRQVTRYKWINHSPAHVSDGFVQRSFWGEFNHGTEGVFDSFEFDNLTAQGVYYQISDFGHPDWEPSVTWGGPDNGFFECHADRSGREGLFLPIPKIRSLSDREIVEFVRTQAARAFQGAQNVVTETNDNPCPDQLQADSMLGVAASQPSSVLAQQAQSGRWQELIALNEHAPDEVLVTLAKTSTRDVALSLLSRPSLCVKAQVALADRSGYTIATHLLQRDDLSRQALYQLAVKFKAHTNDVTIDLLKQVANHRLCDFEIAGLLPAYLVRSSALGLLAGPPGDLEFDKLVGSLAKNAAMTVDTQTVRDTARRILAQAS